MFGFRALVAVERKYDEQERKSCRDRKSRIEEQDLDHIVDSDRIAEALAIGLESRRAPQHCGPLQDVERSADVFQAREQEVVLDVEHPRNVFGPLEHDAELHEVVRDVSRDGALTDA